MDSYTEQKKIDKLLEEERKKLELKKKLKKENDEKIELKELLEKGDKFLNKPLSEIVWQDFILKQIKPKLFTSLLEMNYKVKEAPTSFFFWGNSRMGKTFLGEKIWEIISKKALVVSMSNYTSEAHLTSLTGTSAGWAWYMDKTILENYIEDCESQWIYKYVIIFDEIEKAHKSVFKFFLELLGTWKVNLLNWKVLDLKNSIIIFTSNLGTSNKSNKKIWFWIESQQDKLVNGISEEVNSDKIKESVLEYFPGEFVNRIWLNNIYVFNDLTAEQKQKILKNQITDKLNKLDKKVKINKRSVSKKIFNKLKNRLEEDNIWNIKKELNHEILMETIWNKYFKD